MIRIIITVLVMMASPAAAAKGCPSAAKVLAEAASVGAHAVALNAYGLEQVAILYNNIPPVSEAAFTAGVLVDLPNGGGIIMLGAPDAMCTRLVSLPHVWAHTRKAILGESL